MLNIGERFAVAVQRYRRERLMIILRSTIQAQREQARCGTVVIRAKSQLADGGVVDLIRCAVLAILAIERAIQKNLAAISEEPLQAKVAAAVLFVDRDIDRAANVLGNINVAIGAKSFSATDQSPLSKSQCSPARSQGRVLVAVRYLDIARSLHRLARLHIDHAAQRVISVQRRNASGNQLHLIERRLRNSRPVDPAAKRIVDGNAIGQNQSPTRPACAQPA